VGATVNDETWPLFCSFLIILTAGRTPWTGDQPVARTLPTHRITQTQNKCTQTSIPGMGFEPTTLVFERSKTVHAFRPRGHCDRLWIYFTDFKVSKKILYCLSKTRLKVRRVLITGGSFKEFFHKHPPPSLASICVLLTQQPLCRIS
jgi:hypothetical protein